MPVWKLFVGESSDALDLLCSMASVRPEVVFLWALDRLKEPGIVSHLLQECPDLKVVVVSPDHFTISDVGTRTRQFSDLSWTRFGLRLWRVLLSVQGGELTVE
jgi:hypothetical protein